ncbi:Ger(x)C family spore germination protein [Bacillus sp. FJAT-49736]|uniref:Ger(x)C family spore germination protein n=1 Tax=Bacillus sp. FJAT-49736 TaxID=2833582 RepID=UPI001BC9BB0F|nr:Ger(x)C family spore germination protein [Bacillus sp. FJAT-49736]MBS4174320.1 Ger(x)C family spore germination protein [Bacillus sp. FJAT-49736]
MYKFMLPLFVISLLLSGCGNVKELNELAIILGAAIDLTEKGEIDLTVQFLNPHSTSSSGGGGAGGGGGKFTIVRSAKGLTVADAISKLQEVIPRKIFWGHCNVFIFGKRLARQGILDAVDYIVRAPQTREQALLFISDGDAKECLNVDPPLEKQAGRVLTLLSKQHILLSVSVKDFMEMKLGSTNNTFLPYITKLPPNPTDPPQGTIPYIKGTALLKNGKMVGILDDSLTRGIMWLRNEVKESQVVVQNPLGEKGTITLAPFQATIKLIPLIQDGRWKMIAKASAKGEITENVTNLNVMNPNTVKKVEKAMEKDISTRIRQSFNQLQRKNNTDIVGFAEEFHRKYPKEWNREEKHWDDIFHTLPLDIQIDAHIIGPGLLTIPSD